MAKKNPWHGKGKKRWRYVTLKKAPPGSYDIGLDQSLAASKRGLRDIVGDIRAYVPGGKRPAGTQSLRAIQDVNLARADNTLQRGYLNQDYATGVANVERETKRTLGDLTAQRDVLGRNYQQLANAQRQGFQAAGVQSGGAGLQAAEKRATNKAFELKPIETAEARTNEDRTSSLDDLLRQQQRGARQLDTQLGEVNLTYGRGVQDRATDLSRARREANQYARDVQTTKMQMYTQGGGRTRRKVGVKQYRKWRRRGVV